jgi:hypothetical protein
MSISETNCFNDNRSHRMKHNGQDDQDPINNSHYAGLFMGLHRPRFRRDAPRWFTLLVFAGFLGMIFAFLWFSRR